MEIILDQKNFETEVLKSPIPVLVDFWAPWCMPCRVLTPIVAEIANDYQGRLKIGKLNVEENPKTASQHQVYSIPTLKLFRNGKIIEEMIGALSKKEIRHLLDKHLTS